MFQSIGSSGATKGFTEVNVLSNLITNLRETAKGIVEASTVRQTDLIDTSLQTRAGLDAVNQPAWSQLPQVDDAGSFFNFIGNLLDNSMQQMWGTATQWSHREIRDETRQNSTAPQLSKEDAASFAEQIGREIDEHRRNGTLEQAVEQKRQQAVSGYVKLLMMVGCVEQDKQKTKIELTGRLQPFLVNDRTACMFAQSTFLSQLLELASAYPKWNLSASIAHIKQNAERRFELQLNLVEIGAAADLISSVGIEYNPYADSLLFAQKNAETSGAQHFCNDLVSLTASFAHDQISPQLLERSIKELIQNWELFDETFTIGYLARGTELQNAIETFQQRT